MRVALWIAVILLAIVTASAQPPDGIDVPPPPGQLMDRPRTIRQDEHELHQLLANAGRYIYAENSGHNIPMDEPQVVVEAVRAERPFAQR